MDNMEDRLKLLREAKIPHIMFHLNNECLICHVTEKEMVKFGAIFLCKKCFLSQFQTDDPMNKERELYLKLIKEDKAENQAG
jgi:hypothetical protein